MKIKCQECGTIIEIEDSEYPLGIEQTIECPLCQNEISFTLSEEINQSDNLPPIPPLPKGPKKVKSRLVQREKQVSSEPMNNSQNEVETNTNDVDWDEAVADFETINQNILENAGPISRFVYYLGYYSNYIKKGIVICGILLAIYFIGRILWNSQSQPSSYVDSDSIEELVDSMAVEEVINESDSIISFLTLMYENSKYENYPFLNGHCTQHLLSVLSEAYDYDCNEPPCYATWLFRTSAQDEKSSTENESRVLYVRDVGDNWFEVEFYDCGWKGKKRIKAYFKDDDVVMDIIETVYDEVAENMKNASEVEDSVNVKLYYGNFPMSILYERKLNESDLEDLGSNDLLILRNYLYARHGYRFSREDLMTYFSQFSWYRPISDDVSDIYEEMTEIEKYNVDFIKSHE